MVNITTQIVDQDLTDLVNPSLLGLAIGQIAFLSVGVYLDPNGSVFAGLYALSLIVSPILVGVNIHLLTDTGWEPRLNGALWILGCLIPAVSSSVLITYVGRRYGVESEGGQWVGWPVVVGGSLLAITGGWILLIAFSETPGSETFLSTLGGMALFSLTPLPGIAMFYDLRFLKYSDEYDFPSYNWLWIPGIIVWFLQFGVFVVWVVWRTKVTSKSNHQEILNIISTYIAIPDITSSSEPDTMPAKGSELANQNSDTGETADGENTVSTAIGHRNNAEAAIETAETAKANSNFGAAADAYKNAIAYYQTALEELDAEATERREEITEAIATTRADYSTVKNPQERRKKAIEILTPPERSFQEAIVAFGEGDFTVAKIRFRQARDTFEEALETTLQGDTNRFSPPVEVSVEPDRELSSTTFAEIEEIPDSVVAALAKHDIETIDELESGNKPPWTPPAVAEVEQKDLISEEDAMTLTLLSWWHSGSVEFDSRQDISKRQQQADYGFDQAS